MRSRAFALLIGLAAPFAAPAAAADLRDYCPERPGLNTPACTIDRGHVSIETGLADWTREKDADAVTDTFLFGDTLIRLGVSDAVEAQLGWTPYGIERMRDRASGEVTHRHGTGDVTLGIKANLSHPDGEGFSLALLPSVTVPVGRQPIGATSWSASARVPVSYQVADGVTLAATPEIDAAADEEGHGRHLAYGSAVGVEYELSKVVALTVEGQVMRDRDPGGHTTLALASGSLAWKVKDDLQFDAGAVAGLNRESPDVEVYVGVSRRF